MNLFKLRNLWLLVMLVATACAQVNAMGDSMTRLPTLIPTRTPLATATFTPSPPPTATAAEIAPPTPTQFVVTIAQTHIAQTGEAWWTIAALYEVPLAVLWTVNPALDPYWLIPGDVVQIPAREQIALIPTIEVPSDAQVNTTGGLRLRETPSANATSITLLPNAAWLKVVGRTADNTWVEVETINKLQGWAATLYLNVYISLTNVPITGEGAPVPPPPTPNFSLTPSGALAVPTDYARFISNVTPHVREIYLRGQGYGRKAGVFSKVGDSITVSPVFLAPIGINRYNLGAYPELQPVIDYYFYGIARDTSNSFTNDSLAAKVGWRARALFSPASADPAYCLPDEAPLVCEYRLVQPSVALIMLGTNDVPYTSPDDYERDMRAILDFTVQQGIVPVLSTLPPFVRDGEERQRKAEALNERLIALAQEYDIPLWDYWAALQGLPDWGMAGDGIHPSWAGVGHNADFTPEYLQYGMVVRNLTGLYALDAVWRMATTP
jgi:hypothetical protein